MGEILNFLYILGLDFKRIDGVMTSILEPKSIYKLSRKPVLGKQPETEKITFLKRENDIFKTHKRKIVESLVSMESKLEKCRADFDHLFMSGDSESRQNCFKLPTKYCKLPTLGDNQSKYSG